METLLILAAIAVAALALAIAAVISAQERRPPLRMQREVDLAEGDEDELIRSLRPVPRSPIDRDAPILDADWKDATLIDAKLIEAEMIEAKLIEDPSKRATKAADGPSGTDKRGTR